jgi:predicted kinase
MKILYIMVGAGFAGKSTLAKAIADQLGIVLVSQDAHYFTHKDELPSWSDDTRQGWEKLLVMVRENIRRSLAAGHSVVFDNTNLTRRERDELRKLADEAGARAVVVFLDTPAAVLDERQARNKITKERHDVEQHYLDDAKAKLEIPASNESVYVFAPGSDVKEFIGKLPKL